MRMLGGWVIVAVILASAAGASAAPSSFPPPGKIVFRITTKFAPGQLQSNLYTARTDGTDRVQITTGGPFFDLEARWSPDGGKVAFTRVDPDGIYSAVWVVGADGSDPHSVSGPPSYAELPRWSPDGRWLAYQEQTDYGSLGGRSDTSFDLWIVRPDGSGRRKLVSGELAGEDSWAWSPEGKQLTYAYTDPPDGSDNSRDLVGIVTVATGKTRFLASGTHSVWSSDGRQIVVGRGRVNEGAPCGGFWVVPASGGTRRRIVNSRSDHDPNALCDADPLWSPDGRWIAFSRRDDWVAKLFVVTPDGRHLTHPVRIPAGSVKWPTDCSRLFFYRTTTLEHVYNGWLVRGAGGAPKFVPLPNGVEGDWHC